jgi:hypothetical protein
VNSRFDNSSSVKEKTVLAGVLDKYARAPPLVKVAAEYWDQPSALAVGSYWDRPSAFAGIDRRLLPSVLAGIDRRLLLGSTASCKVSSANRNYTRRFGAAERRTFSVFLIAI